MDSINYELELPNDIDGSRLRKFIMSRITKKGELIRWSIYEIANCKNKDNKKIIKINALVLD
tara:strand:- start:330 stop:515 length:186 start_codon:yes stop_codon:yes gene_type:complete